MTPFQLDASAKAPCTSTIVGLTPVCSGRWSAAFTGEPPAPWIGRFVMVRDGRRRSRLGGGPRSRTDLIMVHVWSADTGPTAQPPGQTTRAGRRAAVLAVRTKSERQRS